MAGFFLNKLSKPQQYMISMSLICIVAAVCYFLSGYIGYKVVALLLLLTVSFIAMFFNLWPVLLAAVLSALIWDFFFIPPRFTFAVHSTEDLLMLLMYFIIALVNAVMTYKIRQIEKHAQQKEEKEKTLNLYNTIFNSLSHELRTPISAIIGAADNLLEEPDKLSEQNKTELISEISKASLRLDRQVENLLNMTRLESGTLQLKKDWCDINELVNDVVNSLNDYLEQRVVSIHIAENLPYFRLDRGIMEQVLYNLIYNAALYVPRYCVITIKAYCKDENLVLIVEDNGYGFPEDEIEKVFEKFYRLKNTGTGGTGLGLSIVKGFVEAHNGTVHLENVPGGGAKFKIEILTEISYLNNLKNE
jgi:two-component system, OmpR family, sensor histidine kinase KdpD